MADLLPIIFSGAGGSAITVVFNYLQNRSSREKPRGFAKELLHKIGKFLKSKKLDYYISDSTDENKIIAEFIFAHSNSTIIATAFCEDPSIYGEDDLAFQFEQGGSFFTRITCEDVCPPDSQDKVKSLLATKLPGSKLIVIPKEDILTKIDGIFCRFHDGTYLCQIALRNPDPKGNNMGTVFHDGISRVFYDYYKKLSEKYHP